VRHSGARAAAFLADAAQQAAALKVGAPVAIRVSPRARRVALRIDAAARQVELVLPRGIALPHGLKFLDAQRGWIAARLAALPMAVPFADGAAIPVLGVPHVIRCEIRQSAPAVAIADGEIRVKGDPAHLPRRVRDHLAQLAVRELTARARDFAARIDRQIARVTVRETKSRWGSCAATGALSFSWRLVMAPEPVIDYVVAHEVAHLAEMNHGPRFWRLVATLVPDTHAPRAWLKRHRDRLFCYG
jgi:predicted metal-dependent hydrolase